MHAEPGRGQRMRIDMLSVVYEEETQPASRDAQAGERSDEQRNPERTSESLCLALGDAVAIGVITAPLRHVCADTDLGSAADVDWSQNAVQPNRVGALIVPVCELQSPRQ